MKLIFDVESSGKCDLRMADDWKGQARLVQLALLLTTDEGEEVSHAKILVEPVGFEIPFDAQCVHGISTEFARMAGVPVKCALSAFYYMAKRADLVIAFNYDFDRCVMSGEFLRADLVFPKLSSLCEMKAMTPVCKIPSPYREGEFKWPKLSEAYQFAFGKPFEKAHDALAEVRATAAVHFWRENKKKTESK
jgi:DNA polymerase-3 subunit alpha